MRYKPYPYQQHATGYILDKPASALFLEMGLGKTVATLTAVEQLMYDSFEVKKVLVIAPKRVAENVWSTETAKWDHLKHLRISKVLGSEAERKKALRAKADIWVINRENVAWLVALYGTAFPFDMMIIDESSSFKSAKAVRFKALRQIRPLVSRMVLLSGTPAPNSLIDLWPQIYLLDRGQRLGETLVEFRKKYFDKNEYIPFGKYELKQNGNEKEIYEKIGDICISMKARDYLDLPPRIDRMIDVKFSDETMTSYEKFEESQILALEEQEITAINAAALATKLLQFANGAVYDEYKDVHEVHQEKLDALEEVVELANGNPVLIFYSYKHDLTRIKARLKKYKPIELKTEADIIKWNKGEIEVMLAHPASAAHGLNLQAGGHIIIWFSHTWSLEYYQQANARLLRQGQTMPVIIFHLVAKGTIDERVISVIEGKATSQEMLIQAVKVLKLKYLNKCAA